MAVITISRELGSGGSYIAKKVAQSLGYHYVDKSAIEYVLSQYGFPQFRQDYETVPGFWERYDAVRSEMVRMLNRTIASMARHGNVVIQGRGSFAVLSGFADVLNVRIQAPLPVRVRQVMQEQQILEPERAEALVKESDKVRSSFIQSWYGVHWDAANAFDLVLDTTRIPRDLAVRWIIEAHAELQAPRGLASDKPHTSAIEVDPTLAGVIEEALDCREEHGTPVVST